MKIRTAILITLACLIIMPSLSQAQLVIDFNKQPEPKQRSIRTGASMEETRANALQTMDFGIEILGDCLQMTSHREDIVIYRWRRPETNTFPSGATPGTISKTS